MLVKYAEIARKMRRTGVFAHSLLWRNTALSLLPTLHPTLPYVYRLPYTLPPTLIYPTLPTLSPLSGLAAVVANVKSLLTVLPQLLHLPALILRMLRENPEPVCTSTYGQYRLSQLLPDTACVYGWPS